MDHQILVEPHDERETDATPVDLDYLTMLMVDVFSDAGVPAGAEASLTLADATYIASLKEEFLDGDGAPTDVLSFPIDGPDLPSPEDHEGTVMLGDVVVCPEVAARQAPDHAGSFEDELALLVIHGALHILGWDHGEPEDREQMWNKERELMALFHRVPARDPWVESDYGESSH